jgi:dTDP-4-dehydrorhamnose 3,5-epimerase-like enzyme
MNEFGGIQIKNMFKADNLHWNEPFDVHDLIAHKDDRGFLFEVLRFKDDDIPGNGQLYTFSIEPGKRRGDHYHKKKLEWFTCVHGEVIVLLSHDSGKSEAVILNAVNPRVVFAGPRSSHALINRNEHPAIILSYSSKQHDPDDHDTFTQKAYAQYKG